MKSFYRKLMIFGTCAILSVSLTACNFLNNQEIETNNPNNQEIVEDSDWSNNEGVTHTPVNSYTIADLKKEFEVLGIIVSNRFTMLNKQLNLHSILIVW